MNAANLLNPWIGVAIALPVMMFLFLILSRGWRNKAVAASFSKERIFRSTNPTGYWIVMGIYLVCEVLVSLSLGLMIFLLLKK